MNPSQNPSALRSKKTIINTLLQLMTQYPYKEITVKHILLESTISRKTFYRNFTSKDDVLDSYLESILNNYTGTLKKQSSYSFLQTLNIIFLFCEKNKDFLFILRDNKLLYLLLLKLNQFIPSEHKKISANASTNSESFTEYIIFFNIGGIWNIISRWVENNMSDSTKDITNLIIHYLSNIKNIDLTTI